MNKTELIEIAKECCFSRQVVGDETVLITFRSEQLQQLAQRIEQPLLELVELINKKIDWQIEAISAQQQQIAELEKDAEILQTNLDAALMQVKQLREALQELMYAHTDKAIALTIKALEETK